MLNVLEEVAKGEDMRWGSTLQISYRECVRMMLARSRSESKAKWQILLWLFV